MMYCCIPYCSSAERKNPLITFHTFPTNPVVAAEWIKIINLNIPRGGTWFPQTGYVVCSKHFSKQDFNGKKLKLKSVPSLFLKSSVKSRPASCQKFESPSKSPLIVKVLKPADDDDMEMDDEPLSELFKNQNSLNNHVTKTINSNSLEVRNRKTINHNVSSQGVSVVGKKSNDSVPSNISKLHKSKATAMTKDGHATDLIEIGPSTFVKINPEVISVAKKVTTSGNTVLQFMMNQSAGQSTDNICQPVTLNSTSENQSSPLVIEEIRSLKKNGTETMGEKQPFIPNKLKNNANLLQLNNSSSSPAILSTNLPVTQNYSSSIQNKYSTLIKQKNRQIYALKMKIAKMAKKVEELETKCVVQERQLDFTSLKRLKAIKKNADQGEPHANFINEQIKGYFNTTQLRWSETTMTQCSVWCRKAPYAYEYFKKSDLFRLPCLATVKRYMKKHPDITQQIKNRTLGVHAIESGDSSSDFEFDDEEDENSNNDDTINKSQINSNTVLQISSGLTSENNAVGTLPSATEAKLNNVAMVTSVVPIEKDSNKNPDVTLENGSVLKVTNRNPLELQNETPHVNSISGIQTLNDKVELPSISNEVIKNVLVQPEQQNQLCALKLNGQEIILQSGNVIHLNSEFNTIPGMDNQYFVIPTGNDQSTDHPFNVEQPVSFVIQKNGNDEHVIFIANDNTTSTSESVSIGASS